MYDDYKVVTIRSKAFNAILARSGIDPELHDKLIGAFERKHDQDFMESLSAESLDERGWPTPDGCRGIGMHEIVLPDCEGQLMPAKIVGYCFPAGHTMIRVRRFIAPEEEDGVMEVHKRYLRAAGIEVKEPRR